jgi:hypothetical protein
VGHAVAILNVQQLAGEVKAIVAGSVIARDTVVGAADLRFLWDVHAWLVQHQLLDGQGLAGLLTEQQLAEGRAGAETYRAQQQEHQ